MKIKLLAIGLMSLFVVNMQASSLQEIIAQNPGTCAVAGYFIGTLVDKKLTTGSLDHRIKTKLWRGIDIFGFVAMTKPRQFYDENRIRLSLGRSCIVLCNNDTTGLIEANHKTIAVGLLTSAMFGGLALLAAKK